MIRLCQVKVYESGNSTLGAKGLIPYGRSDSQSIAMDKRLQDRARR